MEDLDNKTDFKHKLKSFYDLNKVKIYSLIFILILALIINFIFKYKNEKENIVVAENYVEAEILLSLGKSNESAKIFKKIINSKNTFYSILALNKLLEKNLLTKDEEILNFFDKIEKKNKSEELADILSLKKALFLIKKSDLTKGNEILQKLIEKNSKLKFIAKEILSK